MVRVINVDWLSLYCGCVGLHDIGNFKVIKQNFSTPQFAEIYNVLDELRNEIVATIQRVPYSSIIPRDCAIVEIKNRILYEPDFMGYVTLMCDTLGLRIRSISRIDVCADFNSFNKGISPERFIKAFIENKIVKMGSTKYTIMGDQQCVKLDDKQHSKTAQMYSYIRFGERSHEVSSYLYNKSKELREIKDKPYIRAAWKRGGLDTEKDVWRLEFSLRNKQMKYMQKKDSIIFRLDCDYFKTVGMVENLWDCCYNKYFDFRKNTGIAKKCRMPKVVLVDNTESTLKMFVPENTACSNRMDKIVLRKLYSTEQNLRCDDDDERDIFRTAAYRYAEAKDMLPYFYRQVMGYVPPYRTA